MVLKLVVGASDEKGLDFFEPATVQFQNMQDENESSAFVMTNEIIVVLV